MAHRTELEDKLLDAVYGKGTAEKTKPSPLDREYEGQSHYLRKGARSLINVLSALDYSKFDTDDAARLTAEIHGLINQIEAASPQER